MAEKTPAAVQFQEMVQTAAQWVSSNPVLLKGQLGIESDTLMVKVGNESSLYSARPYLQGGCPVGGMIYYAGVSIPSGYFPLDGRAISRTTYSALYNVIGTTWGAGNGSTTFNIPNSYGRFPQHITAGPDGEQYYDGWNHSHNTWFTTYASHFNAESVGNIGDDRNNSLRSLCYTVVNPPAGIGYTYGLQCRWNYSNIAGGNRYGNILSRGDVAATEGPYPKLNLYVLIKY